MKKIEIIWRELLFQSLEKKKRQFRQKDLALKFGFSTSTIFQALKPLRKMGAVEVGGRFFVLHDPEKILYHWASMRNLKKDLLLSGHSELSVFEIEGQLPPTAIFGGYTAAKEILKGEAPADYDKVYVYAKKDDEIKTRLKLTKGRENLFILKADCYLKDYGEKTTLAQTFVDLWNLSDWYAKDFIRSLKEEINGLLS